MNDRGYPHGKDDYAAYYDNDNIGKDDRGRTVLNPAGINLGTEVAKDLGYSSYESGWVEVTFSDIL